MNKIFFSKKIANLGFESNKLTEKIFKYFKKMHRVCSYKLRPIITGDMKYDLSNQDNPHTSQFTDLILNNSYFPVINKLTQISDSSATTIHHIWTNLLSNHTKTDIILNPISDYLSVFACTTLHKPAPNIPLVVYSTKKILGHV